MRVHRPLVDELLRPNEGAAVREVAGRLEERLGVGARVVWATCDAQRAPSELGLEPGRLVNLRVVFCVPTAVRLGLAAWTDTVEYLDDGTSVRVAVVAHEVEKVVRMATRQAWFSLALQAGAEVVAPSGPFAALAQQLPALFTRGAAQTLTDLARGLAAEGAQGEATRVALGAIRLGTSGLLNLHAPGQFVDADDQVNADRLLNTAQAVVDGAQLPTVPPGFDDVSAWLVAARLEESRGAW